ncbi:GD13948, related, partial [Eimeria acervulina]
FAPYAPTALALCQQRIAETLQQIEAAERGDTDAWPDRDTLECSLDVLSSVAESLGEQLLPLLQQQQQLLLLLERCCSDKSPSVLQSALALVGDLAKHCAVVPRPEVIFPLLQQHLLHGSISVVNNAGWALGELSLRVSPEVLSPFAVPLSSLLICIIHKQDMHKALLQNVAITLGRLAGVCPSALSPLLPDFLSRWCVLSRTTKNDADKAGAFRGYAADAAVAARGIGCMLRVYY